MAKHNQQWLDARWKQKKRQRDAESKRREWELSDFARQADEALEHMRQFSDWAEPMIERLDFFEGNRAGSQLRGDTGRNQVQIRFAEVQR